MAKLRKKLKKIVSEGFKLSFTNGTLDEVKVINVVGELRAMPQSDAIVALSAYQHAISRELARTTLQIESAQALSSNEVEQLQQKLQDEFVIERTEVKLDSSLVGGLKLKIGDYIYEDSIKSRIQQVKEVLLG